MVKTEQSWLSWTARGLLVLGFLLLISRLIELQGIKGSYYKQLSDNNRIRKVTISAPRGKIFARDGEILVGNKEKSKKIVYDDQLGYIKTDDLKKEGESVVEWERDYLLGSNFGHVSGYLGQADDSEVGNIDPRCPEKGPVVLGQLVGKVGLEKEYNCILSGIDGEMLVEVDTTGQKIRVLGIRQPIPGQDLATTISKDLQNFVNAAFLQNAGAVVVTDTKGEVLALQSFPAFNPGAFNNPAEEDYLEEILVSPSLPLFNRVISGAYHPGSVFKPTIALGALSEAAITKDFLYNDPGIITVNDFSYSNWFFTQYGGLEGEINIVRALARSTDTFFYKVGEFMGIEKLVVWANKLGFGKNSGIDLPGEVTGLVPSPLWKERTRGENWFLGNTYHFAIGQGDVEATPIQINASIATLAAGGEHCVPHVARRTGLFTKEADCEDLDLQKEAMEVVQDGMLAACSAGGTGFTFFDFTTQVADQEKAADFRAACKTGTAETLKEDVTHAWFVAYAPVKFPEIVTTVLVEEGGEGSSAAGPIAREIFDYWFYKDLEVKALQNGN